MFGLTLQGGMCQGTPDLCKTPIPPTGTPPVPYPNIVTCATADSSGASSKVYFCSAKAMTKDAKWNSSNGDEAGVAGGVVSGGNLGEVSFLSGSMKVKLEGKAAVKMGDPTKHNGSSSNIVGAAVAPSQTTVKIMG